MASFEDIEQENINYATENYDRDIAMSQRFAQAQKSVDWNEHPFLDLQDANKASRNPIERVFDESDLKNLKSDTGDIAWNSFRKGVLDLQSFGDKAEMALGNTLAGISGNTLGTEMRDRAADSLMKTMEESRFIDSNYGDAETWTARFVGGGMSMGEMLAVGAATGGVGLGAYVGTLSLSDGALNDMAKYQEEHGSLDGYKTDPVNLALDYANAVFQVATEEVGGAGRFLNGKVLKAGKTGSAIAKETLINFLQESAQGAASDLTEVLKGNQNADVLLENATGYLKDGVVAGVLGGVLGGATYKLNKHRAIQNLNEINKVLHPDKNEQEINKISEEVFAKTEEKMEKSFVPELVAQTEAVNDKGKIRDNVRNKVAAMYEDADMSEKQKAKTIEATTTLELENMLYDSIERKIPLTSHPLLQGEVNELGWFREGIPEHRRAEIESLRQEYVSMRDELKAENESADKNYQKIEELETKIELFKKDIAKKLADMAVADKQMIQDMIEEQRKIVRESQARKQMLAETKRKAEKAAQKQDKEEAILAEKIATGAEKAREQRVKKETAQQTKEAKIRSLQEQRNIARTIKAVKVSLAQQKQTPAQMQKQATEPQVMFQDQFNLADENARLDDIYPAYDGETIEVDGKERTVYNSNGDRIAKSKEALTNFWRWFGDSKVVDEQGRPLVVYHGTKAQFDEFLGEKIGQSGTSEGVGFYFTNDENVAKGFGDVMSVYLKLEKPIYAYAQVFMAEDYDGDLDIMEANAEMIRDASMQVLEDLKAKGYEFYDETTSQMADIYTETDYDSLVNTIEMYIKDGIKAEEYDENKLYNDIREAIIKEFGFDGFKTKGYGSSNATVYVALMSNQIKSVDNRGTYSSDTGNIYKQNKVSGAAPSTYRGAYVPEYRFIQATENMDASTLNHELAHDWGQEYFRWARSGKASESFLRSWGAVEKAIGITDKDTYFTYDASEKFARAYEGWLLQRKDWADILKIDTPDERKAVEEMMEDYRQELVDIYDSLLESSKYFKITYGEVGELKPELVEFFERATRYDDIELRQKRGEITEEQANQEKLNHLVETAVNGQAEQEPAGAPEMMEDLRKAENDTERFETEGGNKKALQTRLDRIALAKDLTANEEAMGRYDSHRDMLAVAEQADEFVKNRRDDALAIINGEMAEQDGLYASDLYTALERVANATGDFDLIDELRHSKIANEMAKELGQRVAGFRNYKGSGDVDVMSTLKSVEKQLNKGYTDDMKALAREDVESLIAELKIADNTAELDKFFDEMECK